jgi:chaperonin GroES
MQPSRPPAALSLSAPRSLPCSFAASSSAVNKPTTGFVVSVGDGYNAKTGKRVPIDIAVGDRVVYSKYAGTEVSTDEADQILLKAEDVIGTLEGDDIAKLKPFSDRVLIAKAALAGATSGGVLLPTSSADGVPTGRVVASGPGRLDEDGVREPFALPAGAAVLYAQFAGVEFEPAKGDKASGYVVVRKDDVIMRLE